MQRRHKRKCEVRKRPMKAISWSGPGRTEAISAPEPRLEQRTEVIVKVSGCLIGEGDLRRISDPGSGFQAGEILGSAFTGTVYESALDSTSVHPEQQVIIPFVIACGVCPNCQQGHTALCERSSPAPRFDQEIIGHQVAGVFGYPKHEGGYTGGLAEFVRVPFAEFNLCPRPSSVSEQTSTYLARVLPAAWQSALNADIHPGDTVAIWGCGTLGQFAIQSAWRQGAGKVIGIDRNLQNLRLAEQRGQAVALNSELFRDLQGAVHNLTAGRGPDSCILTSSSPPVASLIEAIASCRPGGKISLADEFSDAVTEKTLGMAQRKGLTIKMGRPHVHSILPNLLASIVEGQFDPNFIPLRMTALSEAAQEINTLCASSENVGGIFVDCRT